MSTVARAGRWSVVLVVFVVALSRIADAAPQSFVNFESGHVRPLALVGGLLFAVNTPDNRLSVYVIGEPTNGKPPGRPSTGLKLAAEISVGLEPVAVAARNVLCYHNGICPFDVWVVNHLSDDITTIQLDFYPATKTVKVTSLDTIPTCDEPRDIVFAGKIVASKGPLRAFVTTARRGQNCPLDAKLGESGVKRGLVQIFEIKTGKSVGTVELFSDTPRGLASSSDGKRVYAAGLLSGNQTTTVAESAVTNNGGLPPPPPFATANEPDTGLIVQFDRANGRWEEAGVRPPATTPKDWSSFVPFELPDYDVFAIDATASVPSAARQISGVGTVLFNLAVRPPSSKAAKKQHDQIFVSNTEALNVRRFENQLRGHLAENRITVIDGSFNPRTFYFGVGGGRTTAFAGWSFDVSPVHLNPHIDYTCLPPGCLPPQAEIDNSLALPNDMVFSPDGKRLYVAALGSGAVGIFDAEQLAQGNVTNREVLRVGGGPSGLALDSLHDRLYVMDRFNNSVIVVRKASTAPSVLGVVHLYDPSGTVVRNGRPFLYDARITSAHGDAACASCHVFGDFDALAWDLGNPFGSLQANCNVFKTGGSGAPFHPMKGPMTTQTLRGLADTGPLHWRGDKSGCGSEPNTPPDKGQFNVPAGFKKFNGAFVGLLGRATELDPGVGSELDQLTDFALSIHYPPNPIRPFTGYSVEGEAGRTFYINNPVDVIFTCNACHALPLGTDALSSNDLEPQEFKIPQLRNMYQKVGMYGVASGQVFGFPQTGPTGKQVRGFGYLHDGSVDRLRTFLLTGVFSFPTNVDRENVEQFLFELDTGLAPIVGQQVTVTTNNGADPSLWIARADAGDCDLVARGRPDPSSSRERGYWYHKEGADPAALFYGDTVGTKLTPADLLLELKPNGWLTYTCVPPGSGRRVGIDRDCDGTLDGDETKAQPDPIAGYPTGLCP